MTENPYKSPEAEGKRPERPPLIGWNRTLSTAEWFWTLVVAIALFALTRYFALWMRGR